MKLKTIFLGLILTVALLVRLYQIQAPIADWHSWRQADTASVTRSFIKEGFNPFLPKYDDSSVVSDRPFPNLERYRFVEFPIYNMIVYPLYLVFGVQEWLHRLVSVIFSLGSLIFLFLIVKKYAGEMEAYISSIIFAMLPFNIFFNRTILPENALVFFALGMIYWWGRRRGVVFASLAFLIKPWAIFFLLPFGKKLFNKKAIFMLAISLMPFLLWRFWIMQFPEGIPAGGWLLNGDNIRFRPAFWWWMISERIGGEILGVTGAFLFFLGLILKRNNYFFHLFALSLFLYFIIFATGNVRHDYYQIIFVPVASVLVSFGLVGLFRSLVDFIPRIFTISLGVLFFVLMFYFSWMQVKELYKINNPVIIEAGKRADQILPREAIVVAPYNGDSAFLYQINRPGWPIMALPIPEMVSKYGVTHLVSVALDGDTKFAMENYEVLEATDKFTIIDLTKMKKQ